MTRTRVRFTGPHRALAAWRRVFTNLTGKEPASFKTDANGESTFEVFLSGADAAKIKHVFEQRWEGAIDAEDVS